MKYFGIVVLRLFFLYCLCSCYILYRLPTDDIDFSLFVLVIVDMDDFTVEVDHGGSFAHDPLRYYGGTISLYKNNIRDYWSGLELKDMVGKLGYLSYDTLHYRLPTVSMEDGGLRVLSIDSDKEQQPRQQLVHTQDPLHMLNQQPVFMATQQLLQPQQ